ncbi:hypothetical protein DFH06DRAFT_1121625 [Mycena polygramma]|nr:hypothetical protein DFH06DRAFT_1121625 [Mycena polygramma]
MARLSDQATLEFAAGDDTGDYIGLRCRVENADLAMGARRGGVVEMAVDDGGEEGLNTASSLFGEPGPPLLGPVLEEFFQRVSDDASSSMDGIRHLTLIRSESSLVEGTRLNEEVVWRRKIINMVLVKNGSHGRFLPSRSYENNNGSWFISVVRGEFIKFIKRKKERKERKEREIVAYLASTVDDFSWLNSTQKPTKMPNSVRYQAEIVVGLMGKTKLTRMGTHPKMS